MIRELSLFFYDPLLWTSTWGCMLMSLCASLAGVMLFVKKRSLLGESLSHAVYPGVMAAALVAALCMKFSEGTLSFVILLGALCTAIIGYFWILWMERKFKTPSDAALCFTLASFLGIGILIASRMQQTHSLWYRQIQGFLYGQAATMTEAHVWIYAALVCIFVFFTILFYPPLRIVDFDEGFARSIGVKTGVIEAVKVCLIALAIVIGIRSVGVVLMSGMLIAPAVAARQCTNRLSMLFILSGVFGLLSGFLGNVLSLWLPKWLSHGESYFSLPTGPMVLLCAVCFALTALLFGKRRGIFTRLFHWSYFRYRCRFENFLKHLWKSEGENAFSSKETARLERSKLFHRIFLFQLRWSGCLNAAMAFTEKGKERALLLIRNHRLWEVYLCELGIGLEHLHRHAEEMEHVITPEMEKLLTEVLDDPSKDPHAQPIPRRL